jgi:hypothetical protein
MTLRWLLADLRTGRQLQDIRPIDGSGSRAINSPEDLSCTLDLNDPRTIALGLRNTGTVAKTILAAAEGDFILGAGPIWAANYDRDGATVKLTAKGFWSYYDHRYIEQLLAATIDVNDFTIPNPEDPTGTIANPDLRTSLSGWDLGTLAKKLLQLAHTYTGGSIPVVFEADRAGTRVENVDGLDLKNLGEMLKQYSQREDGPEIRFLPRFTADRLGIEAVFQTGSEAQPLLASQTVHNWDMTVRKPAVSGLKIDIDGTDMAGLAWLTGGRKADEVLIARSLDTTLTDTGYPLLEKADTSHSSVEIQGTLDAYARAITTNGRRPRETWSFKAETARKPFLGAYLEGDWCDLKIDRYEAARPGRARRGDPWVVEGGTFRHRILRIGWSVKSPLVDVQCMEKVAD